MTFSSDLLQAITARSWLMSAVEHTLCPRFLDEFFANAAELQYTRDLLFSSVVELMSLVVYRIQPSVNSAYQKNAVPISVSLTVVFTETSTPRAGSLGRDGPHLRQNGWRRSSPRCAAASPHCCRAIASRFLTEIIWLAPSTASRSCARWGPRFAGSGVGRARPAADARHRRGPLRGRPCTRAVAAGADRGDRPCQGRLDRRPQLLHDRFLVRDRTPRGFLRCSSARRDADVHSSGKEKDLGRVETGKVFEQTVRFTNDTGEIFFLRRITVVFDKPTRDGDSEIHILTNLPKKVASANGR